MKKTVALVIAAALTCAVALLVVQPERWRVERELETTAPPELVYAQLSELHRWPNWSGFERDELTTSRAFIGRSYLWNGRFRTGEGRITITATTRPQTVISRIELQRPFKMSADVIWHLSSPRPGVTRITATMEGSTNFALRAMNSLGLLESRSARRLDAGLLALKGLSEAQAVANATPAPPAS